jgi:Sodium/glutamate symporter
MKNASQGQATIRADDLPDAIIVIGRQMDRERGVLFGFAEPAEGHHLKKKRPFSLDRFFQVFPVLGRDYDAAVIGAGFIGLSLGATPTGVANMSALTHRYGASAKAFPVVPLVGAFFVDLLNAVVISIGYRLLVP